MGESVALGLFEGYGVELEYMIVDRRALSVRPLADRVLTNAAGRLVADFYNGSIAWSNELVNHVLELKTNGPVATLDGLSEHFHRNVLQINGLLSAYGATLLGTGAHPFMEPHTDTHLWPHESGEIYELYDRIFDCRGHGWSNLQSIHLNLPFRSDAEFERLHAAVRILLPLLPALSASSPLLDGRLTGWADSRLEAYRHNQERFPSIAGKIIPEAVFSEENYDRVIFAPIRRDIAPHDPDGLLSHYFLNSRGAIARFDRGTIEIRIIDIQESPLADIALIALFVLVLKHLVSETWCSLEEQKRWSEDDLAPLFLDVIRTAEETVIRSPNYLRLFGLNESALTAGDLWRGLFTQIGNELPEAHRTPVAQILAEGCLSTRIRRRLPDGFGWDDLRLVYSELAVCLRENRLFD